MLVNTTVTLHLHQLESVDWALQSVFIPQKTLFHPLVSLEWESCASPPTFDHLQDAQAAVLNNKVYVSAAGITEPSGMMGFASNIVLYMMSGAIRGRLKALPINMPSLSTTTS